MEDYARTGMLLMAEITGEARGRSAAQWVREGPNPTSPVSDGESPRSAPRWGLTHRNAQVGGAASR